MILILFTSWIIFNPIFGFEVYWNVPTEKCRKYNIYFDLKPFNIIQNRKDKFRGDKITINYNPGNFPRFEKDRPNGKPVYGGFPENANVTAHIQSFTNQVNEFIPKNFKGKAILDFESYQPDYDIAPMLYKQASRKWIRKLQPNWDRQTVHFFAKITYNAATKYLFEVLLDLGKILRPGAKFGYYGYPLCRNYGPSKPKCAPDQIPANDRMKDLFVKSSALYSSIYVQKNNFNSYTLGIQNTLRLKETLRNRKSASQAIYPYLRFKYVDNNFTIFLNPMDLWSTMGLAWYNRLSGVIIWGHPDDVESKKACWKLKNYVKTTLGPVVKFVTSFGKP